MNHPAAMFQNVFDNDLRTLHVEIASHGRIELARFQSTVARAIENRLEPVGSEQVADAVRIFRIERHNSIPYELPGLTGPDADDLAGITLLKIVQRVEAGNAGDASDEQWERIV